MVNFNKKDKKHIWNISMFFTHYFKVALQPVQFKQQQNICTRKGYLFKSSYTSNKYFVFDKIIILVIDADGSCQTKFLTYK